jgi:triphosphoribosyl-dephospho-CoA synthase
MLSLALELQTACIWEATARKAGNVHRYRDFEDLTYVDFLLSAAVVAPVLARAAEVGIGEAVLKSIDQTRQFVPTNSNLGIALLLAPLAAAADDGEIRSALPKVLKKLTIADSVAVFSAIRLAGPGGLGNATREDVWECPTLPLRDVMVLAKDRDLIARQYAQGFQDVLEFGVPALLCTYQQTGELETAIITTHLQLLSEFGDSHVARRAGQEESDQTRARDKSVLELGWPSNSVARHELIALDRWLREPGKRRNPGSTADLIVACLFIALHERSISLPVRFRSSVEPLP